MNTAEEYIKSINTKLQALIKNYITIKKEKVILEETIKELKESEKTFLEKIDLLETQNSVLKASADIMNTAEKNEFEKRIKGYIKDIEACITMLNN